MGFILFHLKKKKKKKLTKLHRSLPEQVCQNLLAIHPRKKMFASLLQPKEITTMWKLPINL